MSRILLVDDHEPVCLSLQTMIQGMGHEAITATSGRQALQVQATAPVDVLVADIFMPEMDGYELIRKFRRDYPRVKIIAMSGGIPRAPGGPYLEVAQKMGAQWVLRKPFSPTGLIDVISEATDAAAHD
ncbi:MAG: response regulator [Verrucomicrobiota bacterium]